MKSSQDSVIVVIGCARCGATLREQFDRGVMVCDRCDREIPVADVRATLVTLLDTMDPERETPAACVDRRRRQPAGEQRRSNSASREWPYLPPNREAPASSW